MCKSLNQALLMKLLETQKLLKLSLHMTRFIIFDLMTIGYHVYISPVSCRIFTYSLGLKTEVVVTI